MRSEVVVRSYGNGQLEQAINHLDLLLGVAKAWSFLCQAEVLIASLGAVDVCNHLYILDKDAALLPNDREHGRRFRRFRRFTNFDPLYTYSNRGDDNPTVILVQASV
jgi:hypothetical protein